jgi:hypothetical protein
MGGRDQVSFNHYGERGSIDILAFHRATRMLLVIEVKTVVPDLGGMLATLDRKVRLAPDIAAERGWSAAAVSRLLVVAEGSTARRRVAQHQAIFETAFPARNLAMNAWLRAPEGPVSGLMFLSSARRRSQRRPAWGAPRDKPLARAIRPIPVRPDSTSR